MKTCEVKVVCSFMNEECTHFTWSYVSDWESNSWSIDPGSWFMWGFQNSNTTTRKELCKQGITNSVGNCFWVLRESLCISWRSKYLNICLFVFYGYRGWFFRIFNINNTIFSMLQISSRRRYSILGNSFCYILNGCWRRTIEVQIIITQCISMKCMYNKKGRYAENCYG